MAAALVVYLSTMARGVLWGDSGEAQLHTAASGWIVDGQIARSHVLFYAMARFLRWMFSLEPAIAANVVSAIAGALAVANVGWILSTFCARRAAVAAGVALWLFAHTPWQCSTSADVIALTLALLSAELIAVLKFLESKNAVWFCVAGLINGLGMSNHNLAMLMWPVYGGMAIQLPLWRVIGFREGVFAGLCFLIGAAPVLVLCVDDYRTRGDLLTTLQSWLVGRYGSKVANVSSIPVLAGWSLAILALNFPSPLLCCGAFGARRMIERVKESKTWLVLGGGLIYGVFGVRYSVADQHVFLAPAMLFMVIVVTLGVQAFLERTCALGWTVAIILCSLLSPLIYGASPAILKRLDIRLTRIPGRELVYRDRFSWYVRPWRCGYDGAERFARETLESLPQGAVLVADPTLATPLAYMQSVRGLRGDVWIDSWAIGPDARKKIEAMPTHDEAIRTEKLFVGTNDPKYLPGWLLKRCYVFEPSGHVFQVRVAGL
ncbi:MAG: hypothetical protein AABZ47_03020 [Planctomycetota bacterium]